MDKNPLTFLALLDSEPEKAFMEFYRFIKTLLTCKAPRPMGALCREDQEEVIDDIAIKCYLNNWKILRKYITDGKSLSGFLYVLAYNAAIDILRKKRNKLILLDGGEDDNFGELLDFLNGRQKQQDIRFDLSEVFSMVKDAILKMKEYCRTLLLLASDEYEPREIVEALKLPKEQNKKISDALRECRKRLKRIMARQGVDIDAFMKEVRYS